MVNPQILDYIKRARAVGGSFLQRVPRMPWTSSPRMNQNIMDGFSFAGSRGLLALGASQYLRLCH